MTRRFVQGRIVVCCPFIRLAFWIWDRYSLLPDGTGLDVDVLDGFAPGRNAGFALSFGGLPFVLVCRHHDSTRVAVIPFRAVRGAGCVFVRGHIDLHRVF